MQNRNLFSRLFSALRGGLDGVRKILHLLLLFFLFVVFVGSMSSAPSSIPGQAALFLQPVGALVEQLDGDPYDRAVAELLGDAPPQTLVQDVVDALDSARDDDRIRVVHLELSGLGGAGLSKLQRIAKAIDRFRESGKPVIASADYYSQSGYYLAAHADQVVMHPEGILFLTGFGSYRTYYKDLLDTVRIDWNVFRVGTHKSFVEPYLRMDMSPEDRESRNRLIEQLWGQYQADVEAARGLERGLIDDVAQNLVSRTEAAGGDMAVTVLDAGLVDSLLGRAELREILKQHAGESSYDSSTYSSIHAADYLDQHRMLDSIDKRDENVAVIVAVGNILNGSQPPGTIGGDSTAALLREALDDDSVKAVVLRVDSSGGSVFASEVIAHEVEALRAAGKPVVASMSSVAASGGYWISVVADKVFASPSTVTGSIGVFGMFPTYQRSLDFLGMATDGVGTTPWVGQLRPDREMSDEMKQLFQLMINDTYDDFISGVADLRGMNKEAVDQVAQGQVWIAADALEHGLIDELGDIDDAIAAAADLADLKEGTFGQFEIAPRVSATEQMILDFIALGESFGVDASAFARAPSSLEIFASRFEKLLSQVTDFNDPKATYSHCFCAID